MYSRISISDLAVRAGTSYRNSGGIVVQLAAIYQNPDYNDANVDYDISVLQLSSPLSLGSTIAPITLPKLNQPLVPGTISQVTGWGSLRESGSFLQLQVVEVPLVSIEECRESYGTDSVTDRMLCAGLREGGKDACQVRPISLQRRV